MLTITTPEMTLTGAMLRATLAQRNAIILALPEDFHTWPDIAKIQRLETEGRRAGMDIPEHNAEPDPNVYAGPMYPRRRALIVQERENHRRAQMAALWLLWREGFLR